MIVYSVGSKQSFEMVRIIRDKILNHLVRFVASAFSIRHAILFHARATSRRCVTNSDNTSTPPILLLVAVILQPQPLTKSSSHRAPTPSPSQSSATSPICAPSNAKSPSPTARNSPKSWAAASPKRAHATTRTSAKRSRA
jgi:hypothetical protein